MQAERETSPLAEEIRLLQVAVLLDREKRGKEYG